MRLATATWSQEQEPSLWVRCECNTRLKGFLHSGKTGVKRFEGTVAEGIQICCLTSLLSAQGHLTLFNAGTQDAFAKGWVAVRNIDPQSPCTSAGRTDTAGSRCVLFSLVSFTLRVQSNVS